MEEVGPQVAGGSSQRLKEVVNSSDSEQRISRTSDRRMEREKSEKKSRFGKENQGKPNRGGQVSDDSSDLDEPSFSNPTSRARQSVTSQSRERIPVKPQANEPQSEEEDWVEEPEEPSPPVAKKKKAGGSKVSRAWSKNEVTHVMQSVLDLDDHYGIHYGTEIVILQKTFLCDLKGMHE